MKRFVCRGAGRSRRYHRRRRGCLDQRRPARILRPHRHRPVSIRADLSSGDHPAAPISVFRRPIYLHVPPGHAKDWRTATSTTPAGSRSTSCGTPGTSGFIPRYRETYRPASARASRSASKHREGPGAPRRRRGTGTTSSVATTSCGGAKDKSGKGKGGDKGKANAWRGRGKQASRATARPSQQPGLGEREAAVAATIKWSSTSTSVRQRRLQRLRDIQSATLSSATPGGCARIGAALPSRGATRDPRVDGGLRERTAEQFLSRDQAVLRVGNRPARSVAAIAQPQRENSRTAAGEAARRGCGLLASCAAPARPPPAVRAPAQARPALRGCRRVGTDQAAQSARFSQRARGPTRRACRGASAQQHSEQLGVGCAAARRPAVVRAALVDRPIADSRQLSDN